MTRREAERDKRRIEAARAELIERIAAARPDDGFSEVFGGVYLARESGRTRPFLMVHEPAFCVVAQGSKRVLLGDQTFKWDTGHYLLVTVDLPVAFEVERASAERPYLGLRLDLDASLVASVLIEAAVDVKRTTPAVKAIDVGVVDAGLLDAVLRLTRLIDEPEKQKVLAPLITKEIVYRLVSAGHAARLSHMLTSGGETRRIARAIGHLLQHFDEPLKIEKIARDLGMSVSGFHHHFKAVTAMSPLQFQKQLRLQEARRLMLGESLDAASAGLRVGYDDPSYFNRDYRKLFGEPPKRNIARLRDDPER